ncbi:MAG TPA: hypothetical protein VJ808_04595 [Gemmatimonadales bacterium]|nr:hypothetical protein [Gemmatimonadales bacterium]
MVLHQVAAARQGPLDSLLTDSQGRFRFAFRADTAALYLLSARHSGIEYFSPPVRIKPERLDSTVRIVVYDTSSTVPVSVEARHLVVAKPDQDGSRHVLDLIVLRNDAQRTRVAPDSLQPSWSGPLPRGTIGLEVGESDVSPAAVARRGDSLVVTAPLAPGEKQVTVEYVLPAGREVLDLGVAEGVPMLNVLAEEKNVVVSGGTLELADSQLLRGRSFHRWTGSVAAGESVHVRLPGRPRTPEWLLAALVAPVVLVLTSAAWYVIRRKRVSGAPPGQLLDALAALDARYLGREGETPTDEWRSYLAERGRLKGLLETSLAARGQNR